jgi:hypothetical protein
VGNLLIPRDRWQRRGKLTAEATPAAPGSRRRWSARWALGLTLAYLAEVAVRVYLARNQIVPLANPDESAYLITARVLAHAGAASNLSYGTFYGPGYPLLLAPIYWFTSNSVTVYHAATVVNSVINALLMPLAYLALRRLRLRRWIAFSAAAAAALVPEAVFYTQYAMSDAVFPVVVLAWLLCVHSWLTARSWRGQYAAAAGAALLAGYSYAVHPRGVVVIAGFGAVALFAVVRRIVRFWSLAPAGLVLAAVLLVIQRLDRLIIRVLYPQQPRSLSGAALSRLTNIHDQIRVLEMAGGEVWRIVLDTWGIGGIGLLAVLVAVFRRGLHQELRIMAALVLGVTTATIYVAPAALPVNQPPVWASGRYPDAMELTFFIVGIAALLTARSWRLVGYAAGAALLAAGTGAVVANYAGASIGTSGFAAFSFAEPTVLAQGWTGLRVAKSTAVAVALLALWVVLALVLRQVAGTAFERWRVSLLVPVAAMNLFALDQMTTHISQPSTPPQRANSLGFVMGTGLKPGEKVAVDSGLWTDWQAWIPQSFEVWWTAFDFFYADSSPVPAGVKVVEVPWPSGKPAQDSWAKAPAGWHVVAKNRLYGWVAWAAPAAP